MRKLTLPIVAIAVLALAGGATAASKYVITNIHQIKPSVRAHLRGHAGPAGPQGLQGLSGPQGAPGLTSVKTVVGSTVDAAPCCTQDSVITATAQCPAGSTAVSGGWVADQNAEPALAIFAVNEPTSSNGWVILLGNEDSNNPAGLAAVVNCAFGGTAGAADALRAHATAASLKTEIAATRRAAARTAARIAGS